MQICYDFTHQVLGKRKGSYIFLLIWAFTSFFKCYSHTQRLLFLEGRKPRWATPTESTNTHRRCQPDPAENTYTQTELMMSISGRVFVTSLCRMTGEGSVAAEIQIQLLQSRATSSTPACLHNKPDIHHRGYIMTNRMLWIVNRQGHNDICYRRCSHLAFLTALSE